METSRWDAERRGYERISWECQARLLHLGEAAGEGMGIHRVRGRNISEGGLQVRSDRRLALRSRLLVEMEAPEVPQGIQAVGSVVWVAPSTGAEHWLVGIAFSDVGETALSRIRSLIRPLFSRN